MKNDDEMVRTLEEKGPAVDHWAEKENSLRLEEWSLFSEAF